MLDYCERPLRNRDDSERIRSLRISAFSHDDKVGPVSTCALRKVGFPSERKSITARARSMLFPTVAILIALSLTLPPLVHAGNGFYYTPAHVGYDTNSNGLHVGIYATSTQYPTNAPSTNQSPQFYAGVEIRSRDPDTDSNGGVTAVYAVTNLHITARGIDPNGNVISGQHFTPIQA